MAGLNLPRLGVSVSMIAVPAVIACSDGAGALTPVPKFALCHETVSVHASSGTMPTFTWEPACGISVLSVRPVTSAGLLEPPIWGIKIPESAPAGPGVRYGVVPRGGQAFRPPVPLVAGRAYVVSVVSTVGEDVQVGGGEAVFTP